MTERRDPIDIYADILAVIDRGGKKTHIIYKANLNFNICKRYMAGLFREGLVKIQSSSPSAWAITEKGREFMEKYREFRKISTRPKVIGHG